MGRASDRPPRAIGPALDVRIVASLSVSRGDLTGRCSGPEWLDVMIANLWRRLRRRGPAAPKTVVLHAGAGKTGTSAIQTWLARNQRRLERHAIFYPPPPEGLGSAAKGKITTGNASLLVDYTRQRRLPVPFDEAAFFAWLDGVLRHPADTILFSSELLPGGDRRKLAELKAYLEERGCRVRVVYAVRNAADHVFSKWGQMVKRHGCYMDWEQFSREPTVPFLRVLDSFSKVFGSEAIEVINYERSKHDIVRRFLATVTSADLGDTRVETINRSLSAHEIELMRDFNKAVHQETQDTIVRDRLASSLSDYFIYGTDAVPIRISLTEAQFAELNRAVGGIVERINRAYRPDEPILVADPKTLTEKVLVPELRPEEERLMRELATRAVRGEIDIHEIKSDGDCLQAIRRAVEESASAGAGQAEAGRAALALRPTTRGTGLRRSLRGPS